jgi:hypothetical protein
MRKLCWTRRLRFWLAPALAVLIALAVLPTLAMPTSVSASESRQARVRAVHAIPDAPNVDIYVNGGKALSNVPFFTVSDYLSLRPGSYRVQVVPAGARPSSSTAVIDGRVTVTAGNDYSIVARGTLAEGDAAGVGATILNDNNQPPAVVGQARVRVAHFSPDAPAVDIIIGGERVISNLNFRQASDYLTVPAGSYEVGVAPAGGSPIATVSLELTEGQVVTAWANGLLGGSGGQAFKVTATEDQSYSETTRLRAVHAVPDAPNVDVYLNGVEAVGDLAFFSATEYLEVYSGFYTVRVVPAGGNPRTDAVIRQTIHVASGKEYSAIARGTVAADQAPLGLSLREDDNEAPEAGEARVRVAHFSPDAPAVDILIGGERVVQGLRFREVSGYLAVPAGSYEVGVAPAGGSPIFTVSLTVGEGQVVTAWANGLLGGSGGQAFKVTPTVDFEAEPVAEEARVRVLHGSADAPAVDVLVDDTAVVSGLTFGNATDYLSLEAGTYNVKIRASGTTTIVFDGPLTVEGGQAYTVAALGALSPAPGEEEFQVIVFEDNP